MRLGIMGGTFDPIHNGHIYIAAAARDAARLDSVLFLPSGNPPHKEQAAGAQDRFEMTSLAIGDIPWAEASRLEIDREGTIYTVDTLAMLREQRSEDTLFVIVGADALRDMPLWRDARRAMELCSLVAVTRPGLSDSDLQSAVLRAQELTGARVQIARAESPDISSTEIRKMAREGILPEDWLPAPVAQYIRDKGLYLA